MAAGVKTIGDVAQSIEVLCLSEAFVWIELAPCISWRDFFDFGNGTSMHCMNCILIHTK